jgi:hypothetical protein
MVKPIMPLGIAPVTPPVIVALGIAAPGIALFTPPAITQHAVVTPDVAAPELVAPGERLLPPRHPGRSASLSGPRSAVRPGPLRGRRPC